MAPTRVKGSVHTKEHFLSSFGLTWGRFETSVREFCLHPRHAVGLMEFRVWCSQHGGGKKVLVKKILFSLVIILLLKKILFSPKDKAQS